MDKLQQYMRSLNPQPNEQNILIYGSEYKLWIKDRYIGTAIWTKDENVGDSFQRIATTKDGSFRQVYVPDRWEHN